MFLSHYTKHAHKTILNFNSHSLNSTMLRKSKNLIVLVKQQLTESQIIPQRQVQDNYKKRKLLGKIVDEENSKVPSNKCNQKSMLSTSRTFGLRAILFAEKTDLVSNGWDSCALCNLHNHTFFSHSSLHILPRKLCIYIFDLLYHECTSAIQNAPCEIDIHILFTKQN